jgi:hypothetical protein
MSFQTGEIGSGAIICRKIRRAGQLEPHNGALGHGYRPASLGISSCRPRGGRVRPSGSEVALMEGHDVARRGVTGPRYLVDETR